MKTKILISFLALTCAIVLGMDAVAMSDNGKSASAWGPQWTEDGKLRLPRDFHRWVFLGAPLTPNELNGGKAAFPEFHNVYVQPEAFAIYQETGSWPEGTILLKELQLLRESQYDDGSSQEASGRGYFPGELHGIDISVKDSARFRNTNSWGFFNFGHQAPPYAKTAEAQPLEACAGCHIANGEDMVFSKFYSAILHAKD